MCGGGGSWRVAGLEFIGGGGVQMLGFEVTADSVDSESRRESVMKDIRVPVSVERPGRLTAKGGGEWQAHFLSSGMLAVR